MLRSQEPVRNEVPDRQLNFIGKAIVAFAIQPIGPSRPVLAHTPPSGSLESGEYLATSVANCASCHTERNQLTGAYLNAKFSGGMTSSNGCDPAIGASSGAAHPPGRMRSWSSRASDT